MRRDLIGAAGVLAAICLVVYGYRWLPRGGPVPVEELARQAMEAPNAEERERAAVELARRDKSAKPHLARVLTASTSPEIRVACIRGAAAHWDYDQMPLLLDLLDDPAPAVRAAAGAAVAAMVSLDVGYRFDDPPEKRQPAIQAFRDGWEQFKVHKLKSWQQRLEKENL